ncbi:acyl-CoA dehydrogenase [Prauserella sp. Am3]|nr:acyl-CoA dehydrogenase [Prauserella sp. Am3]
MSPDERAAIRAELAEAVRGLLAKHADVRAAMAAPRGYEEEVWSLLCRQVGVAGLAVPERYGGAGASVAEVGAVAHELGRALTPTPLLGSAVLAAGVIIRAGGEDACARLLPDIAAGARVAALVWSGVDGDWSCAPPMRDRGGTLDGAASYVLDGDTADVLVVLATDGDSDSDDNSDSDDDSDDASGGVGVYEVDARHDGVERADAGALDPTRRLATVRMRGVPGRRLGTLTPQALRRLRADALAVLAAEQTGAAERALERTVEYALQRHQFGRPIGGFQAVGHRLADAYVRLETARSACHAALESASGPDDEAACIDAAVAKVVCSESSTHIAAEMIQLHGGIAITWEHDAHLYFKRAHGSAALFGPPQRYIDALTAYRLGDGVDEWCVSGG